MKGEVGRSNKKREGEGRERLKERGDDGKDGANHSYRKMGQNSITGELKLTDT